MQAKYEKLQLQAKYAEQGGHEDSAHREKELLTPGSDEIAYRAHPNPFRVEVRL